MDNLEEILKHGHTVDRAFLFSLLQKPNTILLESSRQDEQNNKNLLFHSPVDILSTNTLADIPKIFHKIEEHLRNKRWIAGYIGYECGYHFESIISSFTNTNPLPLIWFGVFDSPKVIETELLNSIIIDRKNEMQHPHLNISESEYHNAIGRLKEYITNGDTYQVNFTDRFEFKFIGDVPELYFELRQKQHVPFGAYINIGESQILSFSPELFFRRRGNSIITKPMKGTCKRGRTLEEDAQLSHWLQTDEKNRSENLMIIDLLRNDIGRICENGSVTARDMYSIEKFETVLQMTSTVNGTLKNGTGYYEIFKSLFPCGSVTGAPKIRTMQIINELEQHQRGVYCGAIGFISPENESVFNVAIRTLELKNGKGKMGVGGGIVYDSNAETELEECRIKAAFLLTEHSDFQLLETILWRNGFTFLEQHVQRLQNSAEYFSFLFHKENILEALHVVERSFHSELEYRVRLLLLRNGEPFIESKEISNQQISNVIKISPDRTDSSNKFLFHKTTNRKLYNQYFQKAHDEHIADYLFLNENNQITEGSATNVFIEKNGKLYTPPIQCGLLSGIYRDEVIRTNPNVVEKIIKLDDLRLSDAIYICNSVRGWCKVSLSQ